jgi:DNA-directed RNA polymerase subunit beta
VRKDNKGKALDNVIMRKSFVERDDDNIIPNLIALQKESYESFLQPDEKGRKKGVGVQGVFESFFPLMDTNKTITLEFIGYSLQEPKFSERECLISGKTFSSSLKAKLRLILWAEDEEIGAKEIKAIKEQEVYFCDIPRMTENGSFIVNGAERVVVSQMRRAPGVFFGSEQNKISNSTMYTSKIIPLSGSWLDFEFDTKNILYFRIDRKRKIPVSSLFKAMGMSNKGVLNYFYNQTVLIKEKNGWIMDFDYKGSIGRRFPYDILDSKTGKVVIKQNVKVTRKFAEKLQAEGFKKNILNPDIIQGYFVAEDVIDPETGEVFLSASTRLDNENLENLEKIGFKKINVIIPESSPIGSSLCDTIEYDKDTNYEDALNDIYKAVRMGELPNSVENAEKFFNALFFSGGRYNLSDVGRMKMNHRLGLSIPLENHNLTKEDVYATVRMLCKIKHNEENTDDIDNLANRRVRTVGELVENQLRIGISRIERSIIEKMNGINVDTIMPQNLINVKPLTSSIKDFFATSQLSQFMDQTNPLSEITHKRRLSALGPGGLTRERAGFEVRDVHPTHYGRICPVETPEGPNIGLISSLSIFARVNKFGFIETPYRKVVKGKVTEEIVYLSALEEAGFAIAQSSVKIDKSGNISAEVVSCRKDGEYAMLSPNEIDFIDVSPKQMVSVATTLVPFLENDDAKRALMGANMMRQAVPLVTSEAPLVGTGTEKVIARDSGCVVVAKRDGIVKVSDSSKIVIERAVVEENEIPQVDIYYLIKYNRTNHDTTINQKPIVVVGQKIRKGEIIADGQSIDSGELALGKNILVAFMPWDGYNYEDSILMSERMVRNDVFTSIHIEEFEVVARDTRLGPEEITRDIPNVGEDTLRKLDETGVIHIGAEIKSGDILVGKTTPKSESPMTPEEKLLKVIFGEKASDVKDSSLYASHGTVDGTVVDVKVFTRHGVEKDERSIYSEMQEIEFLSREKDLKVSIIEDDYSIKLNEILVGQTTVNDVKGLKKGSKITKKDLDDLTVGLMSKLSVKDAKVEEKLDALRASFKESVGACEKYFEAQVAKVKEGDDLNQGVLKVVKVFIATKQKIQPGDKMAGRHGNKGVISRILPMEDMPYLEDGTPIDIVLNPIGVPSRMNIGQILETHLGWASLNLGKQITEILDSVSKKKEVIIKELKDKLLKIYINKSESETIKKMDDDEFLVFANRLRKGVPFATGVFEDIKIAEIDEVMINSGVDTSGQILLIDGRTGEYFDRKVTVGVTYMLKLHHLVEGKIHARSIGPYSLITQQPLGGKSHFGGQRFGEMECWALQAYGAAYTLQEMLTVKSDDVLGRVKIYESIIQGTQNFTCGIPESFNVMVKEVRSLCLDIELVRE